ncbi:formyltransferase family protein [Pectinatus haikarae]|uniref:formyltransferase family protein n=1 Tax=Pectinatus haikarae TaxID=349096 RepID=UPI0018C5E1A0|nr:formyltransferase family protein [Pectinatus haikarae]
MNKAIDSRPSIALFAYSQPGFACLEELIAAHANLAAVFTHTDSSDEEIWFNSVYDLAKKKNIPVYRSVKIDEAAFPFFAAAAPDIVLSAYYRAMIPSEFLRAPRLGAYNLHGSLLPKYRGRACINWAVLNGEKQTGVTMHVMTEKADQGDIIAQKIFPIDFQDTGYDIFLKASTAVKNIVKEYLPLIENGKAPHRKQDETQATKFGRRCPEDGIIDWQDNAEAVYNLIRSVTHPFPGAFTFLRERKIFIWQALPLTDELFFQKYGIKDRENMPALIAGSIITVRTDVLVKCGRGFLLLKDISLADKSDSQLLRKLSGRFSAAEKVSALKKYKEQNK